MSLFPRHYVSQDTEYRLVQEEEIEMFLNFGWILGYYETSWLSPLSTDL